MKGPAKEDGKPERPWTPKTALKLWPEMCGILASLPMPSPEHVNEREPVREKMQEIVVEILETFPEKSFTKRGRRLRLSKEFVRLEGAGEGGRKAGAPVDAEDGAEALAGDVRHPRVAPDAIAGARE